MVRSYSLEETARFLGGSLRGEDRMYSGVSTDTRTMTDGDLYVALRGENFDGNEFATQALNKGASGIIVEDAILDKIPEPAIVVADTTIALGQLGLMNRLDFSGKVVGVTGSSGKTTVKNMLTSVLSAAARTASTERNLNNEIGVPLTLLGVTREDRYVVVEMGARAPGDIRYLCGVVRPDVVVLLNAGTAHVGEFGSYENIVRTKGEILDNLDDKALAVINGDDPACQLWRTRAECEVVVYSLYSDSADVYAEDIRQNSDSSEFTLCVKSGGHSLQRIDMTVPLPGLHNVSNALCAAAVGLRMGIAAETVVAGLSAVRAESGRLERICLADGLEVFDDSYNANPDSVKASLEVLSLSRCKKKVAVLGSMAELGEQSAELHQQVGRYAAELGIDELHACGVFAEQLAAGFGSGGHSYGTREALIKELLAGVSGSESILVKGSRVEQMEQVVEALKHQVNR